VVSDKKHRPILHVGIIVINILSIKLTVTYNIQTEVLVANLNTPMYNNECQTGKNELHVDIFTITTLALLHLATAYFMTFTSFVL